MKKIIILIIVIFSFININAQRIKNATYNVDRYNVIMKYVTHHKEPSIGPEMVYVKGGTFQMGSKTFSNEQPVHNVTVSSFYMNKYEITNKEFCAFLNEYGSDTVISGQYAGEPIIIKSRRGYKWSVHLHKHKWHPIIGYTKRPVIYVTWYGANQYCEWLSKKTGQKYRLPTEAEWEYAARESVNTFNSNSQLYSGSNNIYDVTWFKSNSCRHTHKVGSKNPNALGIYDLTGNVMEWCYDWYDCDYYSNSPTTNPQGPSSGSYRVLRGGSWYDEANYCRLTFRYASEPWTADYRIGFRIIRIIDTQTLQ